MSEFPAPFQIATLGSALLWPLAAGVAVVVWSRARAAARAKRLAALDGELEAHYRDVERRPVPGQLKLVVDALEEGQELASGAAKAGSRKGTPAGS